ncbi:MAG TPA: sensor histidine kinase, partial [Pseudonocardiaceae bacterium]|nr:sensor histidine kinase [Pseudonocardiaceae bacterium]
KQQEGGFTERDQELLHLLATHAAIALVNARLYERSRELSIMEERNRIARELHDAVTQKLFSLRLTADAAITLIDRDPARAAAELATVRQLAADATGELRAIMVGLRPADLAGDGLDVALRKQADLLGRVHNATVRFTGEPVAGLSAARQEAAYRIAQEALHNSLRHGDPGQVVVTLTSANGTAVLEIADDGTGFGTETSTAVAADPSTTATRRLGLASMRERAAAVGGRLSVSSRPGGGVTVRLTVPVEGGTDD